MTKEEEKNIYDLLETFGDLGIHHELIECDETSIVLLNGCYLIFDTMGKFSEQGSFRIRHGNLKDEE